MLAGEAGAEQALNAAQKKADDYRACIVTRQALSDVDEWEACLREVDPVLANSVFGPSE